MGSIVPSITPPQLVQGKAVFTARLPEVWLELQIDGARSPKDCGISPDGRLLGVGLESVAIHVTDSPGTIKAVPMFGAGWGARAEWGTWTTQTHAYLAIPIPPQIAGTEVRIDLGLRGHVNWGNPRVRCILRNLSEERTRPVLSEIEFQLVSRKQTASVPVSITPSHLRLASKPFTLIPGRYCGELCLYSPAPLRSAAEIGLILRGLSGQAVARQTVSLDRGVRGVIRISLDFLVESPARTFAWNLRPGISQPSKDGRSTTFRSAPTKPDRPACQMRICVIAL